MTCSSGVRLNGEKFDGMSPTGLAECNRTLAEAELATDVGERIHDARQAACLNQRERARRMGSSHAAIDRLDSGGVGATLTTLQRVATALGLEVNAELRPSA